MCGGVHRVSIGASDTAGRQERKASSELGLRSDLRSLKIAIVHDWLTGLGGQEKVLLAWHELFPKAPIYTSVYNRKKMPAAFGQLDIRTTWLQRLPFFRFKHQFVAPLRALAFRMLKLKGYDLVLSMSSAESKFVRVDSSKTLHICYCNTPTRYYWSHYDDYKKHPGFGKLDPLIRLLMPFWVRLMRRWDYAAAQKVAVFIGNSKNVSARIKKYYHRDSYSLFPPVETDSFRLDGHNRNGLLVVGRQIPYKRFDLAVAAANRLDLSLTVIGDGPEHDKLVTTAGKTVKFKRVNDNELAEAYASAEVLLFPGEEDAGIVPLEAMASGTPVVAFSKGGALESVVDGKTGVLFSEQTVDSLAAAIKKAQAINWNRPAIRAHARAFSKQAYLDNLAKIISREFAKFKESR